MAAPSQNALHLYRALLRECTYLPNRRARSYMYEYVQWSYRTHLPRNKVHRQPMPFMRQVALLCRGRKVLSLLRRANDGYLKPIEKVVGLTYGRRGKRRRELMGLLMAPEIPSNAGELAEYSPVPPYTTAWRPPPKVRALIDSQMRQRPWLENVTIKMSKEPKIPEMNAWKRPLHPRRVRNKVKAWYVKNVDAVRPPLPDDEWRELRGLAKGDVDVDLPVKRRAPALADHELRKQGERCNNLLEGPEKGRTFGQYLRGRPHRLTRRLMQRIYASVFRHVPRFFRPQDKWIVTWDDEFKARAFIQPSTSERDDLLFPQTRRQIMASPDLQYTE